MTNIYQDIRNVLQSGKKQSESVITSKTVEETILTGEKFAATLKTGDIVLLKGDLGTGKTHFTKGVARFFDVSPDEVQSPSFSLIHEYPGRIPIYHLDCYRLRTPEEARDFGLEEYLYGNGICLIEWPEKIITLLPKNCRIVEIRHKNEKSRDILIHQQI